MKKIILILLLLPLIASSQSFNVFDIDTSEYPIMKAKFYSIDENGDQILNHTTSDFEITENGNPAEVLSVSCPEPKTEPVSYVIAVDVSGSMSGEEIVTLKNSLNYFIDIVPNDGSEVAIIAFNSGNHYVSDFTQNKSKLKSRVDALSIGGGTDFDAAFINPVAGALIAMEGAKHQNRNVIIITDGMATGDKNAIINKSRSLGTKVFGMLIKNQAPTILKNIFNKTGGISFENIITEDNYVRSFSNINQIVGNDPCEISLVCRLTCENKQDIEIQNKVLGLKSKLSLKLNNSQYLLLDLDKYFIDFGTNSTDTIITVTAKNSTQIINDIKFEPDNGDYEIITTLPITIPNNGSFEIKLRYSALDDSREYTRMELIGDYCNTSLGLLKGDISKPLAKKTINLTHPNGGEVFVAGSDTIITWEGITKTDEVKVDFSSNNGKNWELVTNYSSQLSHAFNTPSIKSDSCLIKVEQINKSAAEKMELNFSKSFGGSGYENTAKIITTNDGGFYLVGEFKSDDGDLTNDNYEYDSGVWVMKATYNFDQIEWVNNYGGADGDNVDNVFLTSDGGLILTGVTRSKDGDLKANDKSGIWVLKLRSNGNVEWSRTYGNTWGFEKCLGGIEKKNGGFLIIGHTPRNEGEFSNNVVKHRDYAFILSLNENGDVDWANLYGGNGYDVAVDIIDVPNDGYVMLCHSSSNDEDLSGRNVHGREDYWLLKLTNDGEIEWSRVYGGSLYDIPTKILQTQDNGFIIAGYTGSSDGDLNQTESSRDGAAWFLKISNLGEIIWSKTYGGSSLDAVNSMIITSNNKFLAVGVTKSRNGDVETEELTPDDKGWVLLINNDGELEISQVFGGTEDDTFESVVEGLDGSFYAVGNSNSDDKDLEKAGNNGSYDAWVVKFSITTSQPLQSDTSDAVFSIIIPDPVIQNNDIDMGEMIVGNTKDTIVSSVICNTGDAPLHVLGVDITGGDAADFLIPRGAGDFYLEKDECQDMMFEFTPSALGNRTAVATIRTTIGDFNDTINIRGVGIDPLIEATTDVVDFGQFELGEGKDTNVVFIKNVGAEDITITETKIIGPDTEQFDMTPLPSFTLTSGDDKELELNYTARYGGRTSSIIEFHYDGVGSPLRSMLFAEGIGGEVYPQVPDAYVGDRVELGLHLGRIKPEGLDEVATNFKATVSYNSTLLAPIDKNMSVTTENTTSFIEIEGQLSGVSQIATVPMKVGLGTAVKSGLVVTEFQLYDANGDSVDYEIEPGVGEFNVLGICEEGGTRLVNPNSEKVGLRVAQNRLNTSATIYLDLIESGQTDLIIYDQLGNAIETAYSGTTNAGSKELSLDLSNYTNGRYYIKLTTPTITKTEIIEVVR